MTLTRAVVRYRDGATVLLEVLRNEEDFLRRAGFRPYLLTLHRDDGFVLEANLWSQDPPPLTTYLHAGFLLFGDEPGSLTWEGSDGGADG